MNQLFQFVCFVQKTQFCAGDINALLDFLLIKILFVLFCDSKGTSNFNNRQ